MMTQEELDRYSQYIDRQQELFDQARPALFEKYE
jgi:hypothetical protein